MKNISEFISGIDWKLLKEQKEELLSLDEYLHSAQMEPINCIISLLDKLEEAAFPKGWKEFDTTPGEQAVNEVVCTEDCLKEDLEAESSSAIGHRCDAPFIGLSATDLIPGKKYNCVYLPPDSAWNLLDDYLNNVTFTHYYMNVAPKFIHPRGHSITVDAESRWEEAKEDPDAQECDATKAQ